MGRAASLNQSVWHISDYFFLGLKQKYKPQLSPKSLTFKQKWAEAELLMSEGCDDHMLLNWGVQFALSTPRPTANGQTSLAHTHPEDTAGPSRLRSGSRLFLPRQCFLQIQQKWEKWDSNIRSVVLSAKGCIQKAHPRWHRTGASSEFHSSHTVNLQTRPAAGLHHFLPIWEAEHTCWLISPQLFNHQRTGLKSL